MRFWHILLEVLGAVGGLAVIVVVLVILLVLWLFTGSRSGGNPFQ